MADSGISTASGAESVDGEIVGGAADAEADTLCGASYGERSP
jgi:hypothetical protein